MPEGLPAIALATSRQRQTWDRRKTSIGRDNTGGCVLNGSPSGQLYSTNNNQRQ